MLFYSALMALDDADRDFVSRIYEQYNKKIYSLAYSILKNSHDAEEIVDEVMIKVINNVEKFMQSDGNELPAQLVIYSRNAAINLYRSKKRRAARESSYTYMDEDGEFKDIEYGDDSFDIDEVLLREENAKIVAKYLKQLKPEYQDTIMLIYALGYSYEEAAGVLGISSNAVGMRLYNAKKKLLALGGDELYERI